MEKKDYSYLIGITINELTILSYSEPTKELASKRLCTCECSCGVVRDYLLSKVLNNEVKSCGHLKVGKPENFNQRKAYLERTSKDKPLVTNQSTGIRNIYYSGSERKYVVTIKRYGKQFRKRALTLKQAIEVKKELVAEIESYFNEVLYKYNN